MPNIVQKESLIPGYINQAYGTQKSRKGYPKGYFLLVRANGERLFPVKDPRNGEYHYGLVRAALSRAAQYGYGEVETKAKVILEKYFKQKKDADLDILEKDGEGKEVFGIVLKPNEPDGQGDSFTEGAVRDACYGFNKDFMNQSYRHGYFLTKDKVAIIESYVTPSDMKIGDKDVKKGTWLMRSEINDAELRGQVKAGVIKGFSIGGYGVG